MKSTLLFLFFCILGICLTEWVTHVHQQSVTLKKAEIAKEQGFSLGSAPHDTLRGDITSLSGTVQWQSRTATQPAQLRTPRQIQQGEELRTGKDGSVSVQLSNGPLVTLSPDTHVNFIQTLPTSIVLLQDQGIVTYETDRAVSVLSLDLLTMLQKGKMTISVSSDQTTVSNTILNGLATEAYNDANAITTVTSVSPGEKFIFDEATSAGLVQ